MALRLSSTGLVADGGTLPEIVLEFIDTVLRGVGQVMLQNNSYAGLLFLIGLFYNSTLFGAGVVVGTVVSTAAAMVLGADRALVRNGMFGFNGALVAVALLYFLQPGLLTWACLAFACICSSVLMAAMLDVMKAWKAPVLTAPFVFTALCCFLAATRFGRLQPSPLLPTAALPTSTGVEGVVTASTLAEGLFNGVAQVFFQDNLVTGALFLLGLLISSRAAFAAALVGSFTGMLVAWGMGAAEPAIRSGAFGFNGVLTAIALGGVFFALSPASLAYGLVATVAATVVCAATSAAFQPLGMPALTLPFVVVTWVFILASRAFPRIRPATTA